MMVIVTTSRGQTDVVFLCRSKAAASDSQRPLVNKVCAFLLGNRQFDYVIKIRWQS